MTNLAATPINVLLIEDSPEYASLVLRWLSAEPNTAEYGLVWTDSLGAALSRLKCGGIDLVLMDLGLPDSTGMETFTSVRSEVPNLPIIVLSGAESEALALQIIQAGAQDYLVKPKCSPEHLVRSLRHAMVRHQLVASGGREPNASKQTRIVGIVGGSGGVGATTVACVLAAEIRHQTDQATLLIDLDSHPGQVAFTAGIEPKMSVQDAIEKADQLNTSLWEELITRRPGSLDILASARNFGEGGVNREGLSKVFSFAARHYRWILMDLGRLHHASAELFTRADDLILVSTGSIPALHQCKRSIELFHELGVTGKHVRLVLNQKHDREPLTKREIENMFGVPIDAILPSAHDDLRDGYMNKRLPSVNSEFRVVLTAVARRIAGLPDIAAKRSPLSLTSLRARFQAKDKVAEGSLAS